MRIARFARGGDVGYGIVEEVQPDGAAGAGLAPETDGLAVVELIGHPFGVGESVRLTGARYALADVRLLAPVLPSKVVAIGRNYLDHVREMGNEPPPEPVIFLKPSTAVAGPRDPIIYPAGLTERVDFEGELAVVIGRLCRQVPQERVPDVIFGYTCANDVTARDLQAKDGQWARAKGFDTFCPLGPWIETDLDVSDLEVRCEVNDEVRQLGSTKDMVFDSVALVSYISHMMTLLPGDVILTGTPAGVSPLISGDVVTVRIGGIGELINPVTARED